MSSFNIRLVLALIKNSISLKQLSHTEIHELRRDFFKAYIKDNVGAGELLEIWHWLPSDIHQDYYIQILLPCFTHQNNPYATQFDGPLSS